LFLWFVAVYLVVAMNHKVCIKDLERELGVTYKTAWRMFHLISQQLLYDEKPERSSEPEDAVRARQVRAG
jgi:hypothetical protein